jgi:hypothetical protein
LFQALIQLNGAWKMVSTVGARTHNLSVMNLLPLPLDHGYSPFFFFLSRSKKYLFVIYLFLNFLDQCGLNVQDTTDLNNQMITKTECITYKKYVIEVQHLRLVQSVSLIPITQMIPLPAIPLSSAYYRNNF